MSENGKDRTALVAVVTGVVTLLLGLCLGAAIGGFGGFLVGRQAGQPAIQPFEGPRELPIPPRDRGPELPEMPLMPDLAGLSGAWVREVIRNSPAEAAGIEMGDMITAVGNMALDPDHPLADVIGQHRPGDRVALTVWRMGETMEVEVTLGQTENGDRAYLGVRYSDFSMDTHPPDPQN